MSLSARRRRRLPAIGSPAWCEWVHATANRLGRLATQCLPRGLPARDRPLFLVSVLAVATGRQFGWASLCARHAPVAELMLNENLAWGVAQYADFARAQAHTRRARRLVAGLDALVDRLAGPTEGETRPRLRVVK